ncbi:hypothetical protein BBP40_003869 [Aspergillus hancockii]|nr:hypothetical protein BBP40_003869 [Aspergillus hancockii]
MDGGPMGFGYSWNESVNDTRVAFDNERLLLGEIHRVHWGLDGQDDNLGFQWNEPPLPFTRPAKKRRNHNPSSTAGLINESFPLGLDDVPTSSRHTTHPSALTVDSTSTPKAGANLLPQILEIFPDICHQYVEKLLGHHQSTVSTGGGDATYVAYNPLLAKERVIEEILKDSSYPRQERLKRKTGEADYSDDKWKTPSALHGTADYRKQACDVLAHEFLHVPVPVIRQLVAEKEGLYSAYLILFAHENLSSGSEQLYVRLKRPRPYVRTRAIWHLDVISELNAAKRKADKDFATYRKRREMEIAEKLNEEAHVQSGNLVECQCCYSDVPSNRTVPCDGASVHFFCFTCIQKTAETQIGMMKYKLQCLDTSECKATFSRWHLEEALDSSLMRKLDNLQQQDEIEQAGLEGLESCPFCDFKAICPPVEEDREFRCYNPTCETISCRLCKDKSHIPETCAEAKKEKGLPARHMVEEAMSEALIRNCPKCKVKIVKDVGCNKMVCSKCSCVMCYLCKKDITREQYNHFGKPPTYCDTHDERKPKRFEEEIEQAQKTAIDKILSENPDMTEEELRVNTDKKVINPSPKSYRPQRPPPPLPAFNTFPNPHRCRHMRHMRQMQGLIPNQAKDILPQLDHQRRPKPTVGQYPPPFNPPAGDVPGLNFPPVNQRGLNFVPITAFQPQLNEHGAGALPPIGPAFPQVFAGLPQTRFIPDGLLPLRTDTDNFTNTEIPPIQTQIPALTNYEPETMPGQSANMPLWLDGPVYNF